MTEKQTEDTKTEGDRVAEAETWTLMPKTDREIHELALDCLAGTIFTDRQLQHERDVVAVFMPLMFMSDKVREDLVEILERGGMLYEHLSKAGPHSINGMPGFFSVNVLSGEDVKRLVAKVKELEPPKEEEVTS